MKNIAGEIYSHYESFFGFPVDREVFRLDSAASIQVLEFDGVLQGCKAFTTIGFCRQKIHRRQEAFVAIDSGFREITFILASTLFYYMHSRRPIQAGESKAGWSDLRPELARSCGKEAFYFMPPYPLPGEFASTQLASGEFEVLMAIPISIREHRYLQSNGVEAFESLMEDSKVDPFHLKRNSIV